MLREENGEEKGKKSFGSCSVQHQALACQHLVTSVADGLPTTSDLFHSILDAIQRGSLPSATQEEHINLIDKSGNFVVVTIARVSGARYRFMKERGSGKRIQT